ncbi:hypothetical protein ZWY2020_021546 [Hordeum vulgare]|nr:hypothetical protein ZWY2020_021546 [Hordeum vulgare]
MSSLSDAKSSPSDPFGRGLCDVPLALTRRSPDANLPLYDDDDPPMVKLSGIRPKKQQLQEEQVVQVQVQVEQAETKHVEQVETDPRVLNIDAVDCMFDLAVHDLDDDYNPEFLDLDIDIKDDDDLFDTNVDFEKGKAVEEQTDDPTEDGDLCLPDSDEDKVEDFGCIMLNKMLLSIPVPRENCEGTVSDSSFISRTSSSQATTQTTTATNDANLTMKLLKMKRDKERQMAARRDAPLEAMNVMAERRAEEAEAKRQDTNVMKVEQAVRRKRAAREKKAEETAAKQEATVRRKAKVQQYKEARAIKAIAARAEAVLKKK